MRSASGGFPTTEPSHPAEGLARGLLSLLESGKAAEVRARLAADFRGWETNNTIFETQFERLVRALRADDGGRELLPRSRL
jgi:hypothetical protein